MVTRREVLLHGAIGAGFIATNLSGVAALAAGLPPKRVSLQGLAWNDPIVSTYRDAVGIMKNMASSKKFSWTSLAMIHGTDPDNYHFCPHGDWYFLPWHRGYTAMYERIIRSLTKNNDFAMPFWDWTANPLMPSVFLDPKTPDGKPNPLFVSEPNWQRTWDPTEPMPDDIVGPDVLSSILGDHGYENFGTSRNPNQTNTDPSWVPAGGGTQGTLEGTPHNLVHNNIGGWMPSASSPRDPLFFMHHSNIDRIWSLWNTQNANSTDPLWTGMKFTNNFLNIDGSYWSPQVSDLYVPEDLGYTYGYGPPKTAGSGLKSVSLGNKLSVLFARPGASAAGLATVAVASPGTASPARPLEVAIQVPAAALAAVRDRPSLDSGSEMVNFTAAREQAATGVRVLAFIRDIRLSETSTTMFRVFVDAEGVSAATPTSDPHYVGTFGFLRHSEHAGHDRTPSVAVDLTDALQRLGEGASSRIKLQIVPVPARKGKAAGTATPGRIEVSFITN